METLHEAYQMAKSNDGAPGIDGVTFEAIEESGEESFLRVWLPYWTILHQYAKTSCGDIV